MSDILEIKDLTKSFGSKDVLKGVTFSVPEHTIFGFVGKNGAGKTTTMKSALGLLKADSGEIYINGQKVVYGANKTCREVGYLPDVPEYYGYMNAREYLKFCGELSGMKAEEIKEKSEELLERVGLSGEKHRIKGYSRGMKQRLGLAQALLHSPKLLICDEPTSALDPLGRKELLDILVSVKDETTVIFSTHILSDVERICDQVALLDDGKIVLAGDMKELKKSHKSHDLEIVFGNETDADTFVNVYKALSTGVEQSENTVVVKNVSEENSYNVLKLIGDNRLAYESIKSSEWSLESLFLEVTKS